MDDLERLVQRCDWRLDALDEWRRKVVEPALSELADGIDGLSSAQQIADAVATKMKDRTRVELTGVQRFGGFLIGCIAVIDFVLGITGHS